jgi:transcriptional regulator with XRE-family HTH domain
MSTDYSETLGHTIRETRETRGISLRDLARRADISPSYLSDVELGKCEPTASKIQRIAVALGVQLSRLLPKL